MGVRAGFCVRQEWLPGCGNIQLAGEERLAGRLCIVHEDHIFNDFLLCGVGQVGLIDKPNHESLSLAELRDANLGANQVINGIDTTMAIIPSPPSE